MRRALCHYVCSIEICYSITMQRKQGEEVLQETCARGCEHEVSVFGISLTKNVYHEEISRVGA